MVFCGQLNSFMVEALAAPKVTHVAGPRRKRNLHLESPAGSTLVRLDHRGDTLRPASGFTFSAS